VTDEALLRGLGHLDRPGQPVEKGRVVGYVDVVHDPESRLSNLLVQTSITEPQIRPGVDRGFSIVAFERDGVPLDVRPVAPGASLVVDIHPEEGQFAEVVTHSSIHLEFFQAKISSGAAPVAPLGIIVVEVVTIEHCLPDALLEDRASAISASLCFTFPV